MPPPPPLLEFGVGVDDEGGGVSACACCAAARSGFIRGFLRACDFSKRTKGTFGQLLPRARAFPDVAHGALERLGIVSEGADGALPKGGAGSIDGIG